MAHVQAYEIIVAQDAHQSRDTAIANATLYLLRFGQNVLDVNVYGSEETDWGIGLVIETLIPERTFIQNMRALDQVESIERVSAERVEA